MIQPRDPKLTGGPEPAPPLVTAATVEEVVKQRLTQALGGLRGVAEAAAPTLVFTVSWLIGRELRPALIAAAALAVVLLVWRIVQRQSPQFVLNSLFGIAIAAVFALRSGRAEDVFLPGIIYNAAYSVLLVGSVLVRWPLVGFLIGSAIGDPTGWRREPAMVTLCGKLTLLLALPCVLRVLVQYPLYLAGEVGWLGVSKLALGWPLQVAALAAMAALLARGATPLQTDELTGAPDAPEPAGPQPRTGSEQV